MIALALLAIVAAVILVRLGWGGRSTVAAAGWAIATIAIAALTMRDGAWGMAIGTVAGIVTALVLVLYAGCCEPPRTPRRAPREAPAIVLPRDRGDLARRIAVFVLVVPAAFAAAQWLAFGLQAAARRGGMGEADAIVLALFLQPVAWSAILTIQMTRAGPRGMITAPVAAALGGTLLWSIA